MHIRGNAVYSDDFPGHVVAGDLFFPGAAGQDSLARPDAYRIERVEHAPAPVQRSAFPKANPDAQQALEERQLLRIEARSQGKSG